MTKDISFALLVITILISFSLTKCGTLQQSENLFNELFVNYSTEFRPVLDQNEQLNVNVSLSLVNVNDFDEVKGIITVSVVMVLSWIDERLIWDADYYNVSNLVLPEPYIWLPKLFLTNPSEKVKVVGNKHFKVRIQNTGLVFWSPVALLKAICSPDVTKFPYDDQMCYLGFSTLGYLPTEVALATPDHRINMSYFKENSEWSTGKTYAHIESYDPSLSVAMFYFQLDRRPLYMIINVVVPIILLVIVTPLVFLLPIGCGERTSYTITVLLSFSVYMTVVSDKMPASSLPVSYLSYLLLICLIISMLAVAINVLQTRIYDKSDEDPPTWCVVKLIICLQRMFVKANTKKTHLLNTNTISPENEKEEKTSGEIESALKKKHGEDITWHIVAKTLDRIYFVTFLLFGFLVSFSFMIALKYI